jgi:NTE family protein
LARFERIALVLSGGGALGAYQAGAYSALEKCGVRPNWIAGTAIGAINAAIIAGNSPHERVAKMRQFWRELSKHAANRRPRGAARWAKSAFANFLSSGPRPASAPVSNDDPVVSAALLRGLVAESVDFERINSGAIRVIFGALNLTTGAETFFDNDRHVLTLDHIMAGTPLPGLPPIAIDDQFFGGSAIVVSALDDARPADTLCFAMDGYDPIPGSHGGISRTAREIAAMRRTHDLRRRIALLGERVPAAVRGEIDIRRCLSEASNTTMTILHLVHEVNAADAASPRRRAKPSNGDIQVIPARWLFAAFLSPETTII